MVHFRNLASALGLLFLSFAPALAQTGFPSWDIEAFCAERTRPAAVPDCVMLQSKSRDTVRSSWSNYSADDREECVNYVLNDDIPPSYMRLEHCLTSNLKGSR